jgi:DNA-binding NtrC family response regulator
MIGTSPVTQDLFRCIESAAKSDLPVVISGEPGTGKETAARAIHASSNFREYPFIAMSCAALPVSRLQAVLRGEETGASLDTSGQRQSAEESFAEATLFLSEIVDLPVDAQASLLHFLESSQPTNLNAAEPHKRNIRLICATARNLVELAQTDRFRADLFYRLQALTIETPNLCDRQQDARALAQHFLDEYRRNHHAEATCFSKDALLAIEQYEWPGNLRELRNRVHQAALNSSTPVISRPEMRLHLSSDDGPGPTLQEARDAAEKTAILSAVRRNRQNLSRAAKELRVSRMTLYRLLSKHHIERTS